MGNIESEPPRFNTHAPHFNGHFERYDGGESFENGEPEFDDIRKEIAQHYGVPFQEIEDYGELQKNDRGEEGHIFVIDNSMVKNQRHNRAFCVVRRQKEDGQQDAWYIDGRLPHVTMLQRLYNHYGISDDDDNEKILGFLDTEEFEDSPVIQEEAKKRGSPIRWFVRETVSPPRPAREIS